MYKTNINKINLNSTDFIESIQTNDLIIGEDDSNSLIINSNNKFVNNSTIDGKLNVNNILEKYDGNIINYNITVASKTSAHPYFGQGSSSCYYIDGNESPFIEFVLGKTYRFKQSDTSNSSHPLRFYKQSNKTTQYTTDVTTNGTPGNSGAYTEINITETTLGRLFYMCQAHGYMGNQIQVKGNQSSGLTLADDTSTNSFHVIPFSSSATGEVSTLKTQSTIGVNPSTGNVGIGTTTPSYPLDVTGDARITSDLYLMEEYGGGNSAFTDSGDNSYTITHNLGYKPYIISIFMRCVSSEYGYAVGNEILVSPSMDGDGARNFGTEITTTQIIFRGDHIYYTKKNDFNNVFSMNSSKWDFYVKILRVR
tara:strand:- start:1163 stop:2260 length:1098 start_codon:yes stop_codon:yes gene_type:complete